MKRHRGKARIALLPLVPGAIVLIALAGMGQSPEQKPKSSEIPGNRPLRSMNIRADKGWIDCGWHLFQGQSIEIWAEGEVFCRKQDLDPCGPDGYPDSAGGSWKPMPKANTGALIGRIGNRGSRYFLVGSHTVVKAWLDGNLYLRINDDNNFDNKGGFKVYLGFH